jgi:hypothetical protein
MNVSSHKASRIKTAANLPEVRQFHVNQTHSSCSCQMKFQNEPLKRKNSAFFFIV